jgi:hypothetical protein
MKKTILSLLVAVGLIGSTSASVIASYDFTALNIPTAISAEAHGTSGGSVVGSYSTRTQNGFIFNGSSYTTLNNPLGIYGTDLTGIDGNNIIGFYNDGVHSMNGFIFNGTSFASLNHPQAVGQYGETIPLGINGRVIVGFYVDPYRNENGFLFDGTNYTTINNPSAIGVTTLTGIAGNNIVGEYHNGSSWSGFLYNGSTFTDINLPSASCTTYINGISGSDIFGYYYDHLTGIRSGFIFDGTNYTTINYPESISTLITGISGSTICGSAYINSNYIPFIATLASVPEPSTYALFGLGALALVVAYRRKFA